MKKSELQNCQFWVFQKPQRIAGFHERVADSFITGSFPVIRLLKCWPVWSWRRVSQKLFFIEWELLVMYLYIRSEHLKEPWTQHRKRPCIAGYHGLWESGCFVQCEKKWEMTMYSRWASSSLENANVCIWEKDGKWPCIAGYLGLHFKTRMFVAWKKIGDDRL